MFFSCLMLSFNLLSNELTLSLLSRPRSTAGAAGPGLARSCNAIISYHV
jgi:hypothetical protein